LRLLALVLAGFVLMLYLIQDRMIFPGTATQGRPEAVARPGPGTELVRLPTAEGMVTALFGPALLPDGRPDPDPAARPALVYFYGNAMCLAFCGPEFERFRRHGLNVLIPDYLGYGMSEGTASELGCRTTAEAAHDWLRQRGVPTGRIVAGGWSLGGAVAIDLASRKPVGGLFAFSTFTSTRDMAWTIAPLPLPGFLFAHKFDSLEKIASLRCPVLLGHGRRDALVPFAMHARLAAAVRSPLTTFVVDDAEHNDFFDVGSRQIDDALATFLEAVEGN
jgi:pimeloyl-ACP methyl ester carboxylesterase